jgi:hypothetical protein
MGQLGALPGWFRPSEWRVAALPTAPESRLRVWTDSLQWVKITAAPHGENMQAPLLLMLRLGS